MSLFRRPRWVCGQVCGNVSQTKGCCSSDSRSRIEVYWGSFLSLCEHSGWFHLLLQRNGMGQSIGVETPLLGEVLQKWKAQYDCWTLLFHLRWSLPRFDSPKPSSWAQGGSFSLSIPPGSGVVGCHNEKICFVFALATPTSAVLPRTSSQPREKILGGKSQLAFPNCSCGCRGTWGTGSSRMLQQHTRWWTCERGRWWFGDCLGDASPRTHPKRFSAWASRSFGRRKTQRVRWASAYCRQHPSQWQSLEYDLKVDSEWLPRKLTNTLANSMVFTSNGDKTMLCFTFRWGGKG